MSQFEEFARMLSMKVVGIEIRTSNARALFDLPGHWQKFKELSSELPEGDTVVVYSNYESDHRGSYNYLIGKRVPDDYIVPNGMVERVIAPSSYEKKVVKGAMPFALINAWKEIWASDKPRLFQTDYEIHHGRDEVDIFVGLC